MGLQNHISDMSYESILIYLTILIANAVRYLHYLFTTTLHSFGLVSEFEPDQDDDNVATMYDVVGTNITNFILLCEQLNMNRVCSYTNQQNGSGSDCVVCLNRLDEGEHVRELPCGHVFHKDCFEGWLDHLNFNCPLCRATLVEDERAGVVQRRVTGDIASWFSSQ